MEATVTLGSHSPNMTKVNILACNNSCNACTLLYANVPVSSFPYLINIPDGFTTLSLVGSTPICGEVKECITIPARSGGIPPTIDKQNYNVYYDRNTKQFYGDTQITLFNSSSNNFMLEIASGLFNSQITSNVGNNFYIEPVQPFDTNPELPQSGVKVLNAKLFNQQTTINFTITLNVIALNTTTTSTTSTTTQGNSECIQYTVSKSAPNSVKVTVTYNSCWGEPVSETFIGHAGMTPEGDYTNEATVYEFICAMPGTLKANSGTFIQDIGPYCGSIGRTTDMQDPIVINSATVENDNLHLIWDYNNYYDTVRVVVESGVNEYTTIKTYYGSPVTTTMDVIPLDGLAFSGVIIKGDNGDSSDIYILSNNA